MRPSRRRICDVCTLYLVFKEPRPRRLHRPASPLRNRHLPAAAPIQGQTFKLTDALAVRVNPIFDFVEWLFRTVPTSSGGFPECLPCSTCPRPRTPRQARLTNIRNRVSLSTPGSTALQRCCASTPTSSVRPAVTRLRCARGAVRAGPSAKHDQLAADRVRERQEPAISVTADPVHVDTALLDQPHRFALRGRQAGRDGRRRQRRAREQPRATCSVDGTSSNTMQDFRPGSAVAQRSAEQHRRCAFGARQFRRAVHHAPSPRAPASAAPRACPARLGQRRLELVDRGAIEPGEELQIRARRRDRRCSARTDRSGTARCAPDRATPCPLRSCRTWCRPPWSPAATTRPCALPPAHLANESHARGDVAPLVAAAHLQRAAVAIVQHEKVVRLQQQVAELGERDALVALRAAASPIPWRACS